MSDIYWDLILSDINRFNKSASKRTTKQLLKILKFVELRSFQSCFKYGYCSSNLLQSDQDEFKKLRKKSLQWSLLMQQILASMIRSCDYDN